MFESCTAVFDRFNRWSGRGGWQGIFDGQVRAMPNDTQPIKALVAVIIWSAD
jgi:hypothetical protein